MTKLFLTAPCAFSLHFTTSANADEHNRITLSYSERLFYPVSDGVIAKLNKSRAFE